MEEDSEKLKSGKTPLYQNVDGFRIPGSFSVAAFRSALAYKPRPGDLFIATYPKCGTTWVQNIVACIYRDGRPFQSMMEFVTHSPFLEMTGAEAADTMKRPGAIKLHLPYHMTPMSSEAKYIFVARNPKDCVVSFYHHTKSLEGYQFQGGDFDTYFELFMEGRTDFGDYFDCVLSWYEHRNDPNVLFITYEDLKRDTRAHVLKIAEFLGPQYKEALHKDEKLFENVICHSSFEFMKGHFNKHIEELSRIPKEVILSSFDLPPFVKADITEGKKPFTLNSSGGHFVRKGIVGDWQNHFSEDQNRRIEKKFKERMTGTELESLWKDIM